MNTLVINIIYADIWWNSEKKTYFQHLFGLSHYMQIIMDWLNIISQMFKIFIFTWVNIFLYI